MLDIATTVLELLGYKNKGLGLDRNLLGTDKALTEKYGLEKLNSLILRRKPRIGENSPHKPNMATPGSEN